MTERVRILLHEAIDIDRLVREYCKRPKLTVEAVADVIGDFVGGSDTAAADSVACQVVALAESDDRDEAVRVPAVEDLLNRLGEVYETALRRRDAEPRSA